MNTLNSLDLCNVKDRTRLVLLITENAPESECRYLTSLYCTPTITPTESMISANESGVESALFALPCNDNRVAVYMYYAGIGSIVGVLGGTSPCLVLEALTGDGIAARKRYLESVMKAQPFESVLVS